MSGANSAISVEPDTTDMCGITAIIRMRGPAMAEDMVQQMTREVAHRGPDNENSVFLTKGISETWEATDNCRSAWTVGLGHRRLSILDLSPAANQPMSYRDRYWTVYNGEVYNYVELRAQLERLGHAFHTSSDTEVILAAYAQWGTQCFERLRGMWGLVIVDGPRDAAIFCRDRLGIKPLYLWRAPGLIAIASEIKQLRHLPGFRPRMNQATAGEYLRTGYEDPRQTFFDQVSPVPAGTWLRISLDTLAVSEPQEYWYPERIQPVVNDAEEAGRLFAHKLEETVKIHLRSDVPVGCALSGGLDSSAIAVTADRFHGDRDGPIHTFTSTFPDNAVDEREYADAVLREIHGSSHLVNLAPAEFLDDLSRFLWCHDEPVGSLSMYAGYRISRLTREAGVPVILNGQGGDEILGGYWQAYFAYLGNAARRGHGLSLVRHLGGALLGLGNRDLIGQIPVMYRRYRARRNPPIQVKLGRPDDGIQFEPLNRFLSLDGQAQRLHQIREMFLPRLLKWEDRNSMAFGVEGRYPYLDHELVELCLSFSPEVLYNRGWTKWPLRLGLKGALPRAVLHRRTKFGFEVPQDEWLCGALRPTLQQWLEEDRPAWDHVERDDVRSLAQRTWKLAGKQNEPGEMLFRIFLFDKWIELFGVTA